MVYTEALLLVTIVVPFLGSVVAALLPTNARNTEAWLAGGAAIVLLVIFCLLYPAVGDGKVVRAGVDWIPQAGLEFVLRLDGYA